MYCFTKGKTALSKFTSVYLHRLWNVAPCPPVRHLSSSRDQSFSSPDSPETIVSWSRGREQQRGMQREIIEDIHISLFVESLELFTDVLHVQLHTSRGHKEKVT